MIKIAVFDAKKYDIASFEENKGNLIEYKYFENRLTKDTVTLAHGFDAVCVFVNDIIDKFVIDELVSYGMKAIFLRCAGYNNVDINYAYGKLHVFRVPAYSPYAVAEHAFALLLTSTRRIHKAYNRTREFNFSLEDLTGFDLYGKKIGVIGTGKIGKIFINICKGFGMEVLAYDAITHSEGIEYVELSTLFKEADIISLHCPLTEKTKYIINKESIDLMKKGVVIINTSRGSLIDSSALLEGIKSRKVGAALLDVYEEEADLFYNDKSNHILDDEVLRSLISMPNVILTSHQAFLTKEALNNIAETTRDNIIKYFNDEQNPQNELCYRCGREVECHKRRNGKCF